MSGRRTLPVTIHISKQSAGSLFCCCGLSYKNTDFPFSFPVVENMSDLGSKLQCLVRMRRSWHTEDKWLNLEGKVSQDDLPHLKALAFKVISKQVSYPWDPSRINWQATPIVFSYHFLFRRHFMILLSEIASNTLAKHYSEMQTLLAFYFLYVKMELCH